MDTVGLEPTASLLKGDVIPTSIRPFTIGKTEVQFIEAASLDAAPVLAVLPNIYGKVGATFA